MFRYRHNNCLSYVYRSAFWKYWMILAYIHVLFFYVKCERTTVRNARGPWFDNWHMANKLGINANKPAVMLIGKQFQIHDNVDIKTNDVRIEQIQSMKYLGICIDNKLSCDVRCDKLCSSVAGKISVLRRIRHFCRTSTRENNPARFWLCLFLKLQQAQNYAANIFTGNFDYANFRVGDLL